MTAGRFGLRVIALAYLAALLVVPVGMVFHRALEPGLAAVWASVTTPEAMHAFYLTCIVVGIAVPLNAIFGVATAWLLVRRRFPGRRLLDALVDLPFAVSPVVVGLALVLVWARTAGSTSGSR